MLFHRGQGDLRAQVSRPGHLSTVSEDIAVNVGQASGDVLTGKQGKQDWQKNFDNN